MDDELSCRICRCEETEEEKLIQPCVCAGSIQFVHESCLQKWLQRKNIKRCEICNYEFKFEFIYAPDTPEALPFTEFIVMLLTEIMNLAVKAFRIAFSIFLLFLLIPSLCGVVGYSMINDGLKSLVSSILDNFSFQWPLSLIDTWNIGVVLIFFCMALGATLVCCTSHISQVFEAQRQEADIRNRFAQENTQIDPETERQTNHVRENMPPIIDQNADNILDAIDNSDEEDFQGNPQNNNVQAENVQADAENEFLAWGENHEFQLEDFVLLRIPVLEYSKYVLIVCTIFYILLTVIIQVPLSFGKNLFPSLASIGLTITLSEDEIASSSIGIMEIQKLFVGYLITAKFSISSYMFTEVIFSLVNGYLPKTSMIWTIVNRINENARFCFLLNKMVFLLFLRIPFFSFCIGLASDMSTFDLFGRSMSLLKTQLIQNPVLFFLERVVIGFSVLVAVTSLVLTLRKNLYPGFLLFIIRDVNEEWELLQQTLSRPFFAQVNKFGISVTFFTTLILLFAYLPIQILQCMEGLFPLNLQNLSQWGSFIRFFEITLTGLMVGNFGTNQSQSIKHLIHLWVKKTVWLFGLRYILHENQHQAQQEQVNQEVNQEENEENEFEEQEAKEDERGDVLVNDPNLDIDHAHILRRRLVVQVEQTRRMVRGNTHDIQTRPNFFYLRVIGVLCFAWITLLGVFFAVLVAHHIFLSILTAIHIPLVLHVEIFLCIYVLYFGSISFYAVTLPFTYLIHWKNKKITQKTLVNLFLSWTIQECIVPIILGKSIELILFVPFGVQIDSTFDLLLIGLNIYRLAVYILQNGTTPWTEIHLFESWSPKSEDCARKILDSTSSVAWNLFDWRLPLGTFCIFEWISCFFDYSISQAFPQTFIFAVSFFSIKFLLQFFSLMIQDLKSQMYNNRYIIGTRITSLSSS